MSRKGDLDFLDPAIQKLEAGAAFGNLPTGEPVIAQRDLSTMNRIYEACTYYKLMKDGGGHLIRVEDGDRYPDIKRLISMIAPLEGTTTYMIAEARVAWLDSKHRIRKMLAKYKATRDDDAIAILEEIREIRYRVVMGDALNSHRAVHVQKVSGSERTITVGRVRQKGILGRVFGR